MNGAVDRLLGIPGRLLFAVAYIPVLLMLCIGAGVLAPLELLLWGRGGPINTFYDDTQPHEAVMKVLTKLFKRK